MCIFDYVLNPCVLLGNKYFFIVIVIVIVIIGSLFSKIVHSNLNEQGNIFFFMNEYQSHLNHQ